MAKTGIGLTTAEYYNLSSGDDGAGDFMSGQFVEVAYWTQGYNGVNSRIPVPAGEFIRLSFNLWIPEAIPNKQVFDFSGSAAQQCDVGIGADGLTLNDQTYFDSVTVNGAATRLLKVGFNTVEIVMTEHRSIDMIGADAVDFLRSFQGQLSSMYWINENGDNKSRFYPGIIYSYVDPDATDVPMPDSTVLVDEWSGQHGSLINFGSSSPFVPKIGNGEGYVSKVTTGDWVRGVNIKRHNLFTYPEFLQPVGSIVTANNGSSMQVRVAYNNDMDCDVISGTDAEIQYGFQYPNVFKVIKPTDPDHPDNLP